MVLSTASALFVSLVIAFVTIRLARRESRQGLARGRLVPLADELLARSRDLRDVLQSPGSCPGCGDGVAAEPLITLGDVIDRLSDLSLPHVRHAFLQGQVHRLVDLAKEVRRHNRDLDIPCDKLHEGAYRLAGMCDRTAEACLNLVYEGDARGVERDPGTRFERGLLRLLRVAGYRPAP